MMRFISRFFILFVCFSLLSGCTGYSFDINENQVYTPPSIYTGFSLADANLQACVEQHIKDKNISAPIELTRLQCSFSGIVNLDGLSQFSRIEQLSLKGNDINQIDELLMLTYLNYLDLSDNPISQCRTVLQLEELVTDRFIHNAEC